MAVTSGPHPHSESPSTDDVHPEVSPSSPDVPEGVGFGSLGWFGEMAERIRREPGRAALAVASIALVVFGTWWFLRPPDVDLAEVIPVAEAGGDSATPDASAVDAQAGGASEVEPGSPGPVGTSPALITVHVAGAVARPGVYRTHPGARVADAIALAGGSIASAAHDRLNLAAPLRDGMRVYVPGAGEQVPEVVQPDGGAPLGETEGIRVVSLNEAQAADFEQLPGVGPAIASAIVAHRDENGPFGGLDDLMNVGGIGPAKFAALEGLIRL